MSPSSVSVSQTDEYQPIHRDPARSKIAPPGTLDGCKKHAGCPPKRTDLIYLVDRLGVGRQVPSLMVH